MCQDNIKIREDQEDLENESVQNVLKQPLIIRKVFESLDFASLLHCRIVSKSWEREATFIMAKKCKVTFKDIESVQDFVNLHSPSDSSAASMVVVESSLFAHVTFQFDVTSEVKKNPGTGSEPLQTFLKNHAKQLTNVETPEGCVSGSDSVSEWTENLLKMMNSNSAATGNPNPNEIIIADDNNNEVVVKQEKEDDASQQAPSMLPEDSNEIIETADVKLEMTLPVSNDDETNLQEIKIHDEDIICENVKIDMDEKSKSLASSRKTVHFSMVDNPEYVPIPYCDEGYNNFADFYPYYLGEHSHETGRRLHILGITNSIILIIIGTFTLTPILYAVAFIQAYALAIGAHYYFERRVPRPVIRNPIYMIMGNLKMWWEVASGQRPL